MVRRIPVIRVERFTDIKTPSLNSLPEDEVSPEPGDAYAEKVQPNTQPPPVADKNPSGVEKKKSRAGEENNCSYVNTIGEFFQRNPPTPQGMFNFVVAVATALLVVITYWQYSMQVIDGRAWVGVSRQSGPAEVVASSDIIFSVVVRNSGKTPALNVTHRVRYEGKRKNETFVPVYSDVSTQRGIGSVGVLAPGAEVELGTLPFRLPQDWMKHLMNGEGILYIHGQIEYEDIFQQPHCTAFCILYESDPKKAKVCPAYNYMTDAKCKDEQPQ